MATPTKKKKEDPRNKFAALVAGLKNSLNKKQDELDEAGIERKALTPDVVDGLRAGLEEIIPGIEEEAATSIMQMIVDVLSEEQPDSDVEDETAAMDDEDDKQNEDEEEEKEVAALVQQVTEMGKAYNDSYADMSEVVQLVMKAFERSTSETKEYDDLKQRLGKMEKQLSRKPRRASQAPETQLDPESKLAKDLAAQTIELPPAFADMAPKGGNSS